MAAEKLRGHAWFCETGLPSDVIIEVDDVAFHLNKVPLTSKSGKLQELVEEMRFRSAQDSDDRFRGIEIREEEDGGEEEEEKCFIKLPHFPGGAEAFESASKFCYGLKIELSVSNVAALRCAAEYLEMTEDYSDDNLVSTTERFMSQCVLKNIKHSLRMLTSCQNLLPMAENLGIVQRCIEAIATKAAVIDPSLFGWPVNDAALKNGNASWFDEISRLSLQFFKRLIFALKALNLGSEVIEICLVQYAKRIVRSSRKQLIPPFDANPPLENHQREILETIISNIPNEKNLRSAGNFTKFMFGLLRTAYILNASESSRLKLERKIGSQLEQATLDDLLIPSYSYLNETLYDVDCVERILTYFLQENEDDDNNSSRSVPLRTVGKLIDGYLSEIASDANLKPEKFFNLAVALPYNARVFDDGIYRAVDVYFKAHPWISEGEREKICSVLSYQKLTLEACTHAAQNERLPLRAVVQVLFYEQLQLRHAIGGTPLRENLENSGDYFSRADEESSAWRSAVTDNQVLRMNMDTMRTRVHELERQCTSMRKGLEKNQRMGPPRRQLEEKQSSWMAKFGCKLNPQFCDPHDPTIVDVRKGRAPAVTVD